MTISTNNHADKYRNPYQFKGQVIMDDSDLKSITKKIYKTTDRIKCCDGKELKDAADKLSNLNVLLGKSVDSLSLFLTDVTDRLNDIVNDCIDCGIGEYADHIISVIDDINDYNNKYIH